MVSPDNTYGIAVYQSYRNRNPYDHDGDGFSDISRVNMNTFGLRAYYRPSQFSRISLEYHTTNEFRRGGNKFDLQPHETDITEQTKHVINSGGLTYDVFFNEYKHKLSVYSSVQHIDRNSYYGMQQDPNAYGTTDDFTGVAGAMYVGNMDNCLFSPATFTGGIEYNYNNLQDKMLGYNRDMKQKSKIGSAFFQNEWKMDYFTLLAGFRLDKHNLVDDLIFSPRINALWKPNDALQARVTWSTGFRAPQAYDEDLHVEAVGGEPVLIKMAKGLNPEKSNSFSGSVDWSFTMGHFQSNLLIESFFTMLDDVFYLHPLGADEETGINYKERRNGDGARVYGANIDYKIAHGKEAQLQIGFTAQRSRYTKAVAWSEDESKPLTKNMLRTPQYYGYFTFTSAPVKNFDFSFSGVYTGKMYVPHLAGVIEEDRMERSPNFMDFNFKANYTFHLSENLKVQLNTGVQNIFNTYQKDLDQGVFRDPGYIYGPSNPRTFFVGFKFFN